MKTIQLRLIGEPDLVNYSEQLIELTHHVTSRNQGKARKSGQIIVYLTVYAKPSRLTVHGLSADTITIDEAKRFFEEKADGD